MVEDAGAKTAADDTAALPEHDALLEDDVLVAPSNVRDAFAETVEISDMRILVGAIVAGDGDRHTLVTTAQQSPDGPFPPAGSGVPVNDVAYDAVLAGSMATDGHIAFVALRASDKGVDLILQHGDEATAGAEWNPPVDLGRPAATVFTALEIGLDAQGLITVFGVSDAGEVWWLFKNPPKVVDRTVTVTPPGASEPITIDVPELSPADPPFSGWQKLAGATVAKLKLANNADGRIILFAITSGAAGGDLVYNEPRVMQACDPADWYGWEPVVGGGLSPFTDLDASLDSRNVMNVFAVDVQSEISHVRQTTAGGRVWTGYVRPGLTLAELDCVAAGLDGNGNIALGACAGDGVVWTIQEQAARSGVWSGWQPSAHAPAAAELDFQFGADGALALFGLSTPEGAGGTVWMIAQAAPDSTEWSAVATPLLNGVCAMAVVGDLRLPAD